VKRRLPQLRPQPDRFDIPTIMDRGLATLHGSNYVQLCAFAIDIDRIYVLDPEAEHLAFGWEVFLSECYALGRIDPQADTQHALLEDTCLAILEQPPDDQGFGSQLLFAVYHAVERGLYPTTLRATFRSWRKRPKQMLDALDALWLDPGRELADHAAYCLSPEVARQVSPALSSGTREALERMQQGSWTLPTAGKPA
jgi:hypothetical protein